MGEDLGEGDLYILFVIPKRSEESYSLFFYGSQARHTQESSEEAGFSIFIDSILQSTKIFGSIQIGQYHIPVAIAI